jgi:Skp family chaperone for outer membrane proteins
MIPGPNDGPMRANRRSFVPMRHVLRLVAPAALLLLAALPAAAQGSLKIGTFDKQRIVDESKLGVGAKSRFEKLQTAREAEIDEKKKSFEGLRKTYEQQEGALSDEKKLERQRELARLRDEVQSAMDNADKDLERAYQQALVEIVQKLDPVIADFAKSGNYDFLLDQTQFAFGKPDFDVTSQLIAKIDALYPATPVASAAPGK